jgi:hypothetical protein
MGRVPHGRDRPVTASSAEGDRAGWHSRSAVGRTDWIGSRNSAAQLVATSRRRRIADLDRYVDGRPPSNRHSVLAAPAAAEAHVRPEQAATFVEMGSGLAFAVGVVLGTVSMLALVVVCGWALLAGL